ncbi:MULTISPECIES: NAD(P)-binding domain-containing protein [Arthrobacter]
MSRIAVLGTGEVGRTLARGLRGLGHSVCLGSRSGKAVEGWDGEAATFAEALDGAEFAVLCVKGTAAEELVTTLAPRLAGVTVLDTTNPIAEAAPTEGVLAYFTGPNESMMERLQHAAPEARFVKAFNSVGAGLMVNPSFPGGTPTMFICGDDQAARRTVAEMVAALGWDVEDMGAAAAARAIEPLCVLWCIPGLRDGRWTHAFKLLRP